MKKRLFTLLFLGLFMGGVFSTANAQARTKIDTLMIAPTKANPDTIVPGVYFTKNWPVNDSMAYLKDTTYTDRLFAGCDYTLMIKIRKQLDVLLRTDTAVFVKLSLNDAIKTTLPDSIQLTRYNHADTVIYIPFSVLSVGKNGTSFPIEAKFLGEMVNVSQTFFTRPEVTPSFVRPSATITGKLNLNIQGGSPQLLISIDGGAHWYTKGDVAAFKQNKLGEIGKSIMFKEPNSCYLYTHEFDNATPPSVNRPVTLPLVADAKFDREVGTHYVASGGDFTFTIEPVGANAGMVPVVKTDRTSPADDEAVSVTGPVNGVYTATIRWIKSPINISMSFKTSNETLEGNSVWGNNGQVYITSTVSGTANVYTVAGVHVKAIAVNAGETVATSLPQGMYVVTLNNRTYKVAVK